MKKIHNKRNIAGLAALVTCIFFLVFIVFAATGNTCDTSPCSCGSSCQNPGSNPVPETSNGDNTVDDCDDGTNGWPSTYVNDITLTSQNSSSFKGGDVLEIKGQFMCYFAGGDKIAFAYDNGSGWKNIYSQSCPGSSLLQQFTIEKVIDDVEGTHHIRAMVGGFTSASTITCGSTLSGGDFFYSDTDDVSMVVVSDTETILEVNSLTHPSQNAAKRSVPIDFNFTAIAKYNIDNCSMYANFSGTFDKVKTIHNVNNNSEYNFTFSPGEGSYIWNVVCYDEDQNLDWFNENYSLDVDFTYPKVWITGPSNKSYQNTTTISVNVSHEELNPDSLTLAIDGVNETSQSYSGSESIISGAASAGTRSFFVYAKDEAGNTNISKVYTVYIDTSKPDDFILLSPSDNDQATSNAHLSPLLDWSDTSDPNFKNYTIQFSTDPSFSYINHTFATVGDTSNSSYQLEISLANNQTWYWQVIAYDKAGNKKTSLSSFSYITNTSDIIVEIISPQNNYGSNQNSVTLAYSVEGSDLDICTLFTNFSGIWKQNQTNTSPVSQMIDYFDPVTLPEGKYIWNVLCNKTTGESESNVINYSLYVDTTAPGIELTGPTPDNNSLQDTNYLIINVTHDEINPKYLKLIWNNTNESTKGYSGSFTNITKSDIPDGTYTYSVWISDIASNINMTETRLIHIDTNAPVITLVNASPYYRINNSRYNVTATITDMFNVNSTIIQLAYPNSTTVNESMVLKDNNEYYYPIVSKSQGVHNVTIFVNDSLDNKGNSSRYSFVVDSSPPVYNAHTLRYDPLSGDSDQEISVNITDEYGIIDTVLLSYEGSNITMLHVGSGIYNATVSPETPGVKNFTFVFNDSVGNMNYSRTFNFSIDDDTKPTISNITYTPLQARDLDPNVTIQVYANVTDRYNLSQVTLMYKRDGAATWNTTMMSLENNLYKANFTPLIEDNWTIQVSANDTSNNTNISNQLTISVFYDYTWNRTPASIIAVGTSPSLIVNLGSIVINNSGDFAMVWRLSNPDDEPDVGYNTSMPTTIGAKETKSISLTASAPPLDGEYPITITIDNLNESAVPSSAVTTTSIVVSSTSDPNLYLFVYLPDIPNNILHQGETAINITARVANFGGGTAYNVSLNFTHLPKGFYTRNQNTTTFSNITTGESKYYSIIGGMMPNAIVNQSEYISVRINSSEGQYKTATEYVSVSEQGNDQAPQAPGGGGGGGTGPSSGGGGGDSIGLLGGYSPPSYRMTINAPKEIEVMKGTSVNFTATVENRRISTILSNIDCEVDGLSSNYVKIFQDDTHNLRYNQTKEYTIVVTIPEYQKSAKKTISLKVSATGQDEEQAYSTLSRKDIIETASVDLIIVSVKEQGTECLNELPNILDQMQKDGFNTYALDDLYEEALAAYENEEYDQVISYCESLTETSKSAYTVRSRIDTLYQELNTSEYKNKESIETLLSLAKSALENGDFDKALKRLREAEIRKEMIEQVEKPSPMYNIFVKYWKYIILAGIAVSLIGTFMYVSQEKERTRNRIKALEREMEEKLGIIRKIQKDRFVDGIISKELYELYMNRHRNRVADIQEETIKLKVKEKGLDKQETDIMSVSNKIKETEKIIQDLQEDYFVNKIIDKKSFMRLNSEYKKAYFEQKRHLEDLKYGNTVHKKKNHGPKRMKSAHIYESVRNLLHQNKKHEKNKVIQKNKEKDDSPIKKDKTKDMIVFDREKHFYMHSGHQIKSLQELADTIEYTDNQTFDHHVTEHKNDFSNWIRDVLHEPALADEVSQTKDKENIIKLIRKHIET